MCARLFGFALTFLALAAPSAFAQPSTKLSGYTLNGETCGGFPKLPIAMQPGYCAGLVASKEDGLVFPRTVVQVPDTRFVVVVDMGGWDPQRGRVLLLDPEAPQGQRVKVLLAKLDLPHGLGIGPDRLIYVGTADTIFRFDPLTAQPATTVATILQGLPGRKPQLSDGTVVARNAHPLKHFVFDRNGRLFVNIGAPSDKCATSAQETKPCAAGEGGSPLAAVWMFTPPAGGIFPALRSGDKNPPHEVFARGLRNSMALAAHPRFPDDGFALLQGENARDLPDADRPNEEINALERGKHYGWPYCYDLTTVSPEYAAYLKAGAYRNLCSDAARYRRPHSLLPPHGAPLGMLYYQGTKFPELAGKLIVGLHGYRPTGSRILHYEVDEHGFPHVAPPPVHYNVSCSATPRTFRTESEAQVAAAPPTELIGDWHKVNGVRPQGAPVGLTVASDGAIWLAEDKNQTIIRIDAEPAERAASPLPCGLHPGEQIAELVRMVFGNAESRKRLTQVRTDLIERHCAGCHSGFDIKPSMTEAQKDEAALRFMLVQDAWVYPGAPEAGRMHERVWGKRAGKIMPANGAQLLASDANYRRVLAAFDDFVAGMVPGARKRIAGPVSVVNRTAKSCGSLPNQTVVTVTDAKPKEKPGFGRIYRPADRNLNGDCVDRDGYYVPLANLRDP